MQLQTLCSCPPSSLPLSCAAPARVPKPTRRDACTFAPRTAAREDVGRRAAPHSCVLTSRLGRRAEARAASASTAELGVLPPTNLRALCCSSRFHAAESKPSQSWFGCDVPRCGCFFGTWSFVFARNGHRARRWRPELRRPSLGSGG